MSRRKVFKKVEPNLSKIEHSRESDGSMVIPSEVVPPPVTEVVFPKHETATSRTRFDFKKWYGVNIDAITYVCQRQIERFIGTNDADLSTATIVSYCENGLTHLLTYCALVAKAKRRALNLGDVDRDLIDGYLQHLASTGASINSQRCRYTFAKSVLVALGRRGVIRVIAQGDNATFPRNPYPNSNRTCKGEKPLPKAQRKAFSQAVKSALMPLFHEVEEPTSELLGYALLAIALHTGRNTTPLLEMTIDCLRPHPKENVKLLVVTKRRGSGTQRVPVRVDRVVESSQSVWTGVVRLIERVIVLTAKLRAEAPARLKNRLWLFRSQRCVKGAKERMVITLTGGTLDPAIQKLVSNYKLQDANGKPLRVNVSILRQTFGNRLFEILNGDLVATASALGNTPRVAGDHYMKPSESAEKQWRFMGQTMQQELQSGNLLVTEKTPTGQCSDSQRGQFAPKNGATCMNFLNCLRCRNYVVTGDDLYRLFSFYWLLVRERDRVGKRKWQRHYAHIVRLIDRDVIERGVEIGVFRTQQVTDERERARITPHPFWSTPDVLEGIQ